MYYLIHVKRIYLLKKKKKMLSESKNVDKLILLVQTIS